jgi:hypothetical protein
MATFTLPLPETLPDTEPHRDPASCLRGPDATRPILYLYRSPDESSSLVIKLESGDECEVHVPPRYKAVLLALLQAWRDDEGENEKVRGFLTADKLGELYARFSQQGNSIGKSAVRAYVSELRARIVRALSSLDTSTPVDVRGFRLIEAKPRRGYRINECGLEIVQPRSRQTEV